MRFAWLLRTSAVVSAVTGLVAGSAGADRYASHQPMRTLPTASTRPAAAGSAKYADAVRGDDAADGSKERPWKSLAFAAKQLQPGDTLYLRAGTFYESPRIKVSGTAE